VGAVVKALRSYRDAPRDCSPRAGFGFVAWDPS
jgi:hypothetical protein